MRVFSVPARYAPEVVAEIRRIIDRVDRHRQVDDEDPARRIPIADAIIPESSLDRSKEGDLVILVAEAPSELAIADLPAPRRLRVAS